MPRFLIDMKAGDNLPEQFAVEFADREAVRAYVIDLASDRLHSQAHAERSIVVHSTISNERGEVLDTLYSAAELPH